MNRLTFATVVALASVAGVPSASATADRPQAVVSAPTTFGSSVRGYSGSGLLSELADVSPVGATQYVLSTERGVVPVTATEGMEESVGDRVVMRDGAVVSAQPRAVTRTGLRRVLAVMVAYSDRNERPFTASQLAESIDTGVSQIYGAQSGGSVRFDADVLPDWVVTSRSGVGACSAGAVTEEAKAAARTQGFNPDAYDHLVIAVNREDCPHAGFASAPGKNVWLYGTKNPAVIAHELGHNLGAGHATSLSCTDAGTRVALSPNCVSTEYGDPFDYMGAILSGEISWSRLMSTWHRQVVGQLVGSSRLVTNSETVTLDNSASSGTTLVTIPRRAAGQRADSSLVLELRAQTPPFDSFALNDPVVTGVTVRLGQTGGISALIDTHPGTATVEDSPLQPGETFTDSKYGITVRLNGVNNGTAQLAITRPPLPPDTVAPGAPYSVEGTRLPDNGVSLKWQPGGDDFSTVLKYEIARDGQPFLTVSETGATFVDDGLAHVYSVRTVDEAGNRSEPNTDYVYASPGAQSPPPPSSSAVGTAPPVEAGGAASPATTTKVPSTTGTRCTPKLTKVTGKRVSRKSVKLTVKASCAAGTRVAVKLGKSYKRFPLGNRGIVVKTARRNLRVGLSVEGKTVQVRTVRFR